MALLPDGLLYLAAALLWLRHRALAIDARLNAVIFVWAFRRYGSRSLGSPG